MASSSSNSKNQDTQSHAAQPKSTTVNFNANLSSGENNGESEENKEKPDSGAVLIVLAVFAVIILLILGVWGLYLLSIVPIVVAGRICYKAKKRGDPVDWPTVCCYVCWPFYIQQRCHGVKGEELEKNHPCCCPAFNPCCCVEPEVIRVHPESDETKDGNEGPSMIEVPPPYSETDPAQSTDLGQMNCPRNAQVPSAVGAWPADQIPPPALYRDLPDRPRRLPPIKC